MGGWRQAEGGGDLGVERGGVGLGVEESWGWRRAGGGGGLGGRQRGISREWLPPQKKVARNWS